MPQGAKGVVAAGAVAQILGSVLAEELAKRVQGSPLAFTNGGVIAQMPEGTDKAGLIQQAIQLLDGLKSGPLMAGVKPQGPAGDAFPSPLRSTGETKAAVIAERALHEAPAKNPSVQNLKEIVTLEKAEAIATPKESASLEKTKTQLASNQQMKQAFEKAVQTSEAGLRLVTLDMKKLGGGTSAAAKNASATLPKLTKDGAAKSGAVVKVSPELLGKIHLKKVESVEGKEGEGDPKVLVDPNDLAGVIEVPMSKEAATALGDSLEKMLANPNVDIMSVLELVFMRIASDKKQDLLEQTKEMQAVMARKKEIREQISTAKADGARLKNLAQMELDKWQTAGLISKDVTINEWLEQRAVIPGHFEGKTFVKGALAEPTSPPYVPESMRPKVEKDPVTPEPNKPGNSTDGSGAKSETKPKPEEKGPGIPIAVKTKAIAAELTEPNKTISEEEKKKPKAPQKLGQGGGTKAPTKAPDADIPTEVKAEPQGKKENPTLPSASAGGSPTVPTGPKPPKGLKMVAGGGGDDGALRDTAGAPKTFADVDLGVEHLQNELDTQNSLTEETQLKLQMLTTAYNQAFEALSNMFKKSSETISNIIKNMQ